MTRPTPDFDPAARPDLAEAVAMREVEHGVAELVAEIRCRRKRHLLARVYRTSLGLVWYAVGRSAHRDKEAPPGGLLLEDFTALCRCQPYRVNAARVHADVAARRDRRPAVIVA